MLEQIATVALVGVGLGYTVARTVGPFGLLAWAREWIENVPGAPSWMVEGLGCPVCVSFWMTMAAAIVIGGGASWWLIWLAGYGLAVVVLRWLDGV